MDCPKCGARIPAGSLYCVQCGEDIHIVPDFDPEVEYNLEQTISGIVEEIREDDVVQDDITPENPKKHSSKKMIGWITLAAILFFTSAGIGIFFYEYNSVDIQVEHARQCVAKEQYDRAVGYYKRALELEENNVDIKFALSEVYFLKNNKIEYEHLLRDIVNDAQVSSEQLESAYGKLIAIYRAREDYKTINELLLNSDNENIWNKYQNYVAKPPEFSIQEGYYSSIQPLKLTALAAGNIYYTLDGSEPSEESLLYTAPIILDDGDYVIKAYFVNQYNIASEYVTKNYHIEIEALAPPEVGAVSGEYDFPTNIEILEDDSEIYYTTDGSVPTLSSTRYTGPFPMPLGKSVFKFIRIDGGRSSSVVERTYNLSMNTEYTPEEAETDVIQYVISTGKIYDDWGHYGGTEEMYKYCYQYVTNVNGIDDFYVIAEIFSDLDGIQTRTGSYYAVNAYTGEIFKLQIDENDNYTLVDIENVS